VQTRENATVDNAARQALADVLEHGSVRTVFQPIVELASGAVVAYEALSRGPAGPL
jgi:EAL domain-containing protein (putative c-di-GMP-specific phosphodiesterase class I)